MRVFKYLFFALLFLILLFFAYGFFFLEDKVQVSRTITIDRPAKMVFKTANSMHHFNAWSPWAKTDPNAKYQFSGPEYGVGSKMSWQGNEEVGSGNQTIIESVPHELVKSELYFDGQGDEPSGCDTDQSADRCRRCLCRPDGRTCRKQSWIGSESTELPLNACHGP